MMKVQAKYMANPTPENMAKMQAELTALSAQMAGAIGDVAATFDASDLFEDDNYDEFIKDNPPPQGTEKYLPIGAVLIATHYEPWLTFASTVGPEDWAGPMKSGWGLKDAKAGREMLALLMEGRHYQKFGTEFRKLKAGQPNKLDKESVSNYKETMNAIKEYMPNLVSKAEKCDNIIAWDLDRVGYLARVFFNMKWIPEAEMIEWIGKAAKRIKEEYADWDEYILSLVIGRGVAFSFDEIVTDIATTVLNEGADLMKKHPLKDL